MNEELEYSTILDVATGTVQQAFAFAKRGCDVTCVDFTESMLAVARKNNKSNYERGDATHLEQQSFLLGAGRILRGKIAQ